MNKFTPIFGSGGIYTKHDFLFTMGGVCGTRGRMALAIVERLAKIGYKGVVYACGRSDMDMALVSRACEYYGLTCDIFTTTGCVTDVMSMTKATIHPVANGYNNVLNARARDFADAYSDKAYIPMGFACRCAIETLMHQLSILPPDLKRIVIYDESGVNVAAIMLGLSFYGRSDVNVMGVTTKHEPYNVVARLLGVDVLDRPQVTFTYTRVKQVMSTNDVMYDGVALSPTSDGHCVKFLETGDMLWINGDNLAIDDINDIKE